MSQVFDMRAAQVQGPHTAAKARVIWKSGVLYVIAKDGNLLFQDNTPEPKKSKVYSTRWEAPPYTLKRKCYACGGHLTLSMKTTDRVLADIGVEG